MLSDKLGKNSQKGPVIRVAGVLSISNNNVARYSGISSDSQCGETTSSYSPN